MFHGINEFNILFVADSIRSEHDYTKCIIQTVGRPEILQSNLLTESNQSTHDMSGVSPRSNNSTESIGSQNYAGSLVKIEPSVDVNLQSTRRVINPDRINYERVSCITCDRVIITNDKTVVCAKCMKHFN